MRFGIWELLIIAVIVVLLFNGKRLARLGQAFRRSKTEYQKGAQEPVDVESRRLPDTSADTGADAPERHEVKR